MKNKYLVAVFLLFLVFTSFGCTKQQAKTDHMSQAIGYYNQATDSMFDTTQSADQILPKIVEYTQKAITEAKQVDLTEWENKYPGFTEGWHEKFIGGNELLLQGLQEDNDEKSSTGQSLINEWDEWYIQNVEAK